MRIVERIVYEDSATKQLVVLEMDSWHRWRSLVLLNNDHSSFQTTADLREVQHFTCPETGKQIVALYFNGFRDFNTQEFTLEHLYYQTSAFIQHLHLQHCPPPQNTETRDADSSSLASDASLHSHAATVVSTLALPRSAPD